MRNFYYLFTKCLATVVLTISATGFAIAQDIHFSQFYSTPLTLNPALTGKVDGNYRIAGIFRSQWGGIPNINKQATFGTPSVSFDMPFFVGKKKIDAVGVGALFVNDYTNGGRLNRTIGMLSASYIKSLGASGKHQLSIGLQGGIQQAKTGNFRFEDQYTGAIFNDQTPSFDAGYNNQSKMIPDFQIGLFYNGKVTKNATVYGGFSLFHLLEPKLQFSNGGESPVNRRYVLHAGAEWDMTPKWTLYPGIIFMDEAKNIELNFGTNVGYHIKKDAQGRNTSIFFGAWMRANNVDAFVAMVGLEFKGVRAGFSYDVTTSSLKNSNSNGSFEVSAIYTGLFAKISDKPMLFCPRF